MAVHRVSAQDISAQILEVIPLAMRAVRGEMRGLARPELSIAQFRILARLEFKPHSNKDLAEWVGVSNAAMSRTIDILVTRGLVQRDPTKHDRREVVLSLTPKGKSKFQSFEEATKLKLNLRIKAKSVSERKKLKEGLRLLKELFAEGPPSTKARTP